jgi:hypothetical protein
MSSFRLLVPTAGLLLVFALVLPFGVSSASAQSADRPGAGEEAPTEQEGYLLADKVFAEPNPASAEVTSLTRDDRVRVVPFGDGEGWYEVYKVGESERVGYAFRPYVSRFGSQGISSYASEAPPPRNTDVDEEPLFEVAFAPTPTAVGATRIVRTWANVRTGPGLEYEAFGVIRPDVPFQVVGTERGWGQIRLQGEPSVGYVAASLLYRPSRPLEVTSPEPVAEELTAKEPMRAAVVGGTSGGGVPDADGSTSADADALGAPQQEALREALSGAGLDTEATVYVTRTGRKFHREGCRHLRSRTFAIPLVEAMMDYSPCRSCKPLQPSEGPEE